MAASGLSARVAVGTQDHGLSMSDMAEGAIRLGALMASPRYQRIGFLDRNSRAVPLALFGSAVAGKPFVPLNYRLPTPDLRRLLERVAPALVVVGDDFDSEGLDVEGIEVIGRSDLLGIASDPEAPKLVIMDSGDPESVAVLLYTSGTTGEPKAALLRHRHLSSYILSTVDFAAASENEATL